MGRLVEAELLLQALDEFRIEALRAAILRLDFAAGGRLPFAPRPPKSPPCEPEMREVAPVSEPEICAITRSTGPPGANCTTAKETNMMPSKVGIMNRMRRMM